MAEASNDTDQPVKVLKSSKGKDMLAIQGFIFQQNRSEIENVFYWECKSRRKTSKCPARARTTKVNGTHKVLGVSEHNHEPDPIELSASEFRMNLKRKAETDTSNNIAKIVQVTLSEFPNTVQSRISVGARRKIVQRVRTEGKPEATEPETLEGFLVPEDLQKSIDGDRFLISDVEDGPERGMIFGTNESLHRLSHAKFWVIDGTFATVPGLFRQLVTIHGSLAPDHTHVFPLVFILMTSKSESLYRKTFSALLDKCEEIDIDLNPGCVITDFEKALINSVQAEFPEARQSCCFFHLSKNLYKFIQQHKLMNEFVQNSAVYNTYKKTQALAFLPAAKIPEAFEVVKSSAPSSMAEFIKYFDETYVNGRPIRPARKNRVAKAVPLYTPSLWSVYENVMQGLPRTSNQAESFHSRWNKLVGAKHVGVLRMINELRNEDKYTAGLIISCISGSNERQKKPQNAAKDDKLSKIVETYDNFSLEDYILAVSMNIKSD